MDLSSLTIKDLVELKPLRPVIQLGNKDDEHEALTSFVWTDNIKKTLDDFCERCSEGKGGGIFLKGHYGTGKSHLLSYLSQSASQGIKKDQNALRYKATPISLIRHRSSESLEDITLSKLDLKPDPNEDRDAYFKKVLATLQQQSFNGYLILYDELSEFLKSKPTPNSLAEDIRFLQFLAEFSSHHQSWVIGAIQEDIEGIGHASRETSLKLKDRFPLRWTLSTLHVEDLLAQRLLFKLEKSQSILPQLFSKFQKLWPESFQQFKSFEKIYPLHPGALDFLMGLGTLFSEHRGVLRFVLEEMKGIGPHSKAPFLERPADQLICADLIFDYFSERFQENLELKDYYHKVWIHLEARCKILIEEIDQPLAYQALKIIILTNLDPRREGIDLEELTAQCMFQLGEQIETAHEYLKDQVLGKFLGRVNYLVLEDQRYKIKLQYLEFELLNKLVDQRVPELNLAHTNAWDVLIPLMDRPPLELATFFKDPKNLSSITWLNTQRRLTLSWSHDACDADLRILLPERESVQFKDSQLTLKPRSLEEHEKQLLTRAAIILMLAQQNSPTQVESQAKTEAEKRMKHESHEWRNLLENLYREGDWFLGEKRIQLATMWDHSGGFEANLEYPVYDLLSERHPHFRNIAPKVEYYNERSLSDLIEGFAKPQRVSESALRQAKLLELVLGIAKPLGIAIKDKSNYIFQFEPNHHPFLQEFEYQLKTQQGQLIPCRENLSRGPYGLPSKLFEFLIWALAESRLYEAYRDQELIPPSKISFYNIRTITHIVPVATLSKESLEQLLRLNFFMEADQSLSQHGLQQHLWQYFIEQIKNFSHYLEQTQSILEIEAWSFCKDKYQLIQKHLKNLLPLTEEYQHNPMMGLEELMSLSGELECLHELKAWLKEFYQFHKIHSKELPEFLIYLQDDFHDQYHEITSWSELSNEREALLKETQHWSQHQPWMQIENWIKAVQDWKKQYIDLYQQFHKRDCQNKFSREQSLFYEALIQLGYPHQLTASSPCDRDQNLELMHKPFCRCGYLPQYNNESPWKPDQLTPFVNSLNIEQNKTEMIQAIAAEDFSKALELISQQNGPTQTPPTKISLRNFVQSLQGKTFNRDQLKQEFNNWLKDLPSSNFEIDDH